MDVINLILPGPEAWVRENFWPSANPTVRANAMKNVRTKDPIVEESLKVVFLSTYHLLINTHEMILNNCQARNSILFHNSKSNTLISISFVISALEIL